MTTDDLRLPECTAAAEIPDGSEVVGVPVYNDLSTPPGGPEVDSGYLAQRRFKAKPGQAVAFPSGRRTVVALGVGPQGAVSPDILRQAAAALARNSGQAANVATTLPAALAGPDAGAVVTEGFLLGAYRYSGRPPAEGAEPVGRLTVVGSEGAAVERGRIGATATCRARDWVNRPPRDLTPTRLAEQASAAASAAGLAVEIWDERRIESEGLGGLAGVAAGASEPPRLIRIEHAGRGGGAVHLIGKGITFDSGGLSLKPPASMMTMKSDMGGAAAVIWATIALGEMDVPTRVVCWAAATENMPSGTAIHPGDVLKARNGKTIEVLNTDAEGRLVLADAMSLAVEQEPAAMVDVATLTGGQRVALGDGVAAVMGSDDRLVQRVVAAGRAAGEPAWELPLHADYRKKLDSEVADLKNVSGDPGASSIMAGLFLQEFAGDVPWAHLDIAAPAWSDGEDGWKTKGGTGWATRTLIELIRAWEPL